MQYSAISDAVEFFPCPAVVGLGDIEWDCAAQPGQQCYGRKPDDAPWCHTERVVLMHHVARANGITMVLV